MKRAISGVAALAAVVAMNGCSGSSTTQPPSSPSKITVFAASSLTNVFAAEASAYKKATGVSVTFSFAGSQDLIAQIQQGAPADVLATADTASMTKVSGGAAAKLFARNRLVIVTAKGNPKRIRSLTDLARNGLAVVLAAPTVPAGKYAAQALGTAHVSVHPKSLEDSVRGVLTKVQLGEADAGIVYLTDVQSTHGAVDGVAISNAPVASYPIIALHPAGQGFVAFVLSATGQAILRTYGFLPPA